jgi:hypothetical protein
MRPASVSQAPDEAGSAKIIKGFSHGRAPLTTAAHAAAGSLFHALPALGVNFG